MKVVSLTRTTSIGPSSRYRVEQYRAALAEQDIELSTQPLFDKEWFALLEQPAGLGRTLRKTLYAARRLLARLRQLRALRRDPDVDIVHVEQQLFPYLPTFLESWLWPRHRPSLLEFDDAIYLTVGHRKKLETLCGLASAVIVGNETLAAFARPHARAVHVIPTTLDLRRYDDALELHRSQRPARSDPARGLRVAWIGLRYNFKYLEELAGPLARLSVAAPESELVVISSALPEAEKLPGVRLQLRPWSEDSEAHDLADCDVAVMPLADTPWAAGKCALKLLQGMAAGLPVIASPVGVNRQIVRDGENGYLASSADEWAEALLRLAKDPALRERLGEEGRKTVESEFRLERGARALADAYLDALKGVASGGSTPPSSPDTRTSTPT